MRPIPFTVVHRDTRCEPASMAVRCVREAVRRAGMPILIFQPPDARL